MVLNSSLEEIERQVRSVSDLPREQLAERWINIYRSPPPKGVSRRLLERAAAYHLQADALGGLKPAVARKLSRLTAGTDGPRPLRSPQTRGHLSAGTRLVREWNGRTHSVEVTDAGFLWNDRSYGSLSAIARAITGARWSGPRFFGL